MKILSCSVQVSATVLLVTICGWILAGVASATNLPEERSQIISVFREAVRLNEEFKASVKTADPSAPHQSEYQEKRKAFEQYSADVLASRLDECVKVLSSNRDVELAKEFFNLLIGLENSANEMLSYSMGTIFLSNPSLNFQFGISNTFTESLKGVGRMSNRVRKKKMMQE